MVVLIIAIVLIAEVVGLYWWRRTSKRRLHERSLAKRRKQNDKCHKAFVEYLLNLQKLESLPPYPPQGDVRGSESVTFYTIVRGDASKVAAVISEKSNSYDETSERHGDPDAVRAAGAIKEMLNMKSDKCSFPWGTNSVEYRLYRDLSDEFMFVEIMTRPR